MSIHATPRKHFLVLLFTAVAAGAALTAGDLTVIPSALWKETGAGLWRELEFPFACRIRDIGLFGGVLYVATEDQGLLVARDGGRTWSLVPLPKGLWVYEIAVSGGRLFLGTPDGLYFADDHPAPDGTSAVRKATDGPAGGVPALAVGQAGLWAAAAEKDQDAVLWFSGDNGLHWERRTGLPAGKGLPDLKAGPCDLGGDGTAVMVGSGAFLYSDRANGVRYVAAGGRELRMLEWFPGVEAYWSDLDGNPVSSLFPKGGPVPDADWSAEEVGRLIGADPATLVPRSLMPMSGDALIQRLCSDGQAVYAALQRQDPSGFEGAVAALARKNDWNPCVFHYRGGSRRRCGTSTSSCSCRHRLPTDSSSAGPPTRV